MTASTLGVAFAGGEGVADGDDHEVLIRGCGQDRRQKSEKREAESVFDMGVILSIWFF